MTKGAAGVRARVANRATCGSPAVVVSSTTVAVVSVLPVTRPRPGKCLTVARTPAPDSPSTTVPAAALTAGAVLPYCREKTPDRLVGLLGAGRDDVGHGGEVEGDAGGVQRRPSPWASAASCPTGSRPCAVAVGSAGEAGPRQRLHLAALLVGGDPRPRAGASPAQRAVTGPATPPTRSTGRRGTRRRRRSAPARRRRRAPSAGRRRRTAGRSAPRRSIRASAASARASGARRSAPSSPRRGGRGAGARLRCADTGAGRCRRRTARTPTRGAARMAAGRAAGEQTGGQDAEQQRGTGGGRAHRRIVGRRHLSPRPTAALARPPGAGVGRRHDRLPRQLAPPWSRPARSSTPGGRRRHPVVGGAPSTERANREIDEHGYDGFGSWHLAVDPDASEDTKGRYHFPYGDFEKVSRAALIHAKQRASQNDHPEIERAADELLSRSTRAARAGAGRTELRPSAEPDLHRRVDVRAGAGRHDGRVTKTARPRRPAPG